MAAAPASFVVPAIVPSPASVQKGRELTLSLHGKLLQNEASASASASASTGSANPVSDTTPIKASTTATATPRKAKVASTSSRRSVRVTPERDRAKKGASPPGKGRTPIKPPLPSMAPRTSTSTAARKAPIPVTSSHKLAARPSPSRAMRASATTTTATAPTPRASATKRTPSSSSSSSSSEAQVSQRSRESKEEAALARRRAMNRIRRHKQKSEADKEKMQEEQEQQQQNKRLARQESILESISKQRQCSAGSTREGQGEESRLTVDSSVNCMSAQDETPLSLTHSERQGWKVGCGDGDFVYSDVEDSPVSSMPSPAPAPSEAAPGPPPPFPAMRGPPQGSGTVGLPSLGLTANNTPRRGQFIPAGLPLGASLGIADHSGQVAFPPKTSRGGAGPYLLLPTVQTAQRAWSFAPPSSFPCQAVPSQG